MAMAMEETSLAELVSSLPVPSVQEIAKEAQINNTKTVPQRYIRPDLDPPFISHPTCLPQVPIIDMNKLLSSEALLMESELQKLHLASQEWGFFQVNKSFCFPFSSCYNKLGISTLRVCLLR